jgi:large subunit ribosomal protein L3
VPGSIGQRQSPGKVFKGKKMSGHLGNKRTTVQNLKLVRVDADKNLLLISGGVPGAANSYVVIYPAAKKMNKGEAHNAN